MKRMFLHLFFSVNLLTVLAQTPETFKYQALVRDVNGDPVVSKTVSVQISVLKEKISGDVVYCERHFALTGDSGYISLLIGSGSRLTGDMKSINRDTDDYFLKVEIDTEGGTAFRDFGTTQMIIFNGIPEAEENDRKAEILEDDELFIVRKYVGRFIDFRHTGPDNYAGPNIIWIKTSMEGTYGKISAYGKACKFSTGDNLYLRRMFYSLADLSGYWEYQIENDSTEYYRVTEFQHDKKVLTETWF
jgi:hypothetical protein